MVDVYFFKWNPPCLLAYFDISRCRTKSYIIPIRLVILIRKQDVTGTHGVVCGHVSWDHRRICIDLWNDFTTWQLFHTSERIQLYASINWDQIRLMECESEMRWAARRFCCLGISTPADSVVLTCACCTWRLHTFRISLWYTLGWENNTIGEK